MKIQTNQNVYDAVKRATQTEGLSSQKSNVSVSELRNIETEIMADGQIDSDEELLLHALKNKMDFSIGSRNSSDAPFDVEKELISFPDKTSNPEDLHREIQKTRTPIMAEIEDFLREDKPPSIGPAKPGHHYVDGCSPNEIEKEIQRANGYSYVKAGLSVGTKGGGMSAAKIQEERRKAYEDCGY